MAKYIDRDAFLTQERAWYCENCDMRKNSKGKLVYEIGETPCLACHINDLLDEVENCPAADVVEVVRCKDCFNRTKSGMCIQWSRYEKIVNTSDYAFCSWGVKTPPSAPEPPKEET